MKYLILGIIWVYQRAISPLLAPRCRFLPTCSEYTRQCFERLPLHQALKLSIRRIGSCHPWSPGGYDPVPSPSVDTADER